MRKYANTLAEIDAMARAARRGNPRDVTRLCEALDWIPEVVSAKYQEPARRRGIDRDDLRQEAKCGVLTALGTWRPEGASFRSYAYGQAVYAALNAVNGATALSMPRAMASRFDAKRRGVEWAGGSKYTDATARSALAGMQTPTALDRPLEGEETPRETLPDLADDDAERVLDRATLERSFRRAANMLTDNERATLAMHYGLWGREPSTYEQIGRALGFSHQNAYNLRLSGLAKLRGVTMGEAVA